MALNSCCLLLNCNVEKETGTQNLLYTYSASFNFIIKEQECKQSFTQVRFKILKSSTLLISLCMYFESLILSLTAAGCKQLQCVLVSCTLLPKSNNLSGSQNFTGKVMLEGCGVSSWY
jgi:hypothetical protein